ncbi:hypothetical protein SARC_06841 [Sphaeroforma arctica JP610]|uniref:Plastocyanin-like domain-containing protein n=1 Tax=Sphaeroforma arctica JP610 TaxID=667725 RepID=A0A0L0FVX8_9EUKA|nr:hypothetical protein SARC_06841 [Sphaeroforma arctica JP610]KNC80804.1 hypothetical protein SARC_06841 [Sphaeroforma arctica JP610]|eukprot:XP_014154706.1 hypothetical protein SARC_06841 [Sphaeroforma arctica JP610]
MMVCIAWLLRFTSSVAVLALASPVVLHAQPAAHYEPLRQPTTYTSEDGKLDVTLTVTASRIHGPLRIEYNTRLYDGEFPGPTLRFKAGDDVNLLLRNELGFNDATAEAMSGNNELHHPNSTNMHLHGMHVASTGAQDNVALTIAPGFSFQYEYKINSKHHAGTTYYHPHLHGSTNLQVFGLMAGAFITEDNPDDTPENLLAMDDLVVMVQSVYLADEQAFLTVYGHNGTSNMPVGLKNPEGIKRNMLMVNGQYKPRIDFAIGELKRLRIISGLASEAMLFGLSKDSACQLYEMAYDGVYLPAPREAGTIFLPSGGRVDVAVQCSKSGSFALTTVPDKRLADYAQIWVPVPGPPTDPENVQPMLMIEVSSEEMPMELPDILPDLPEYLQKARDEDENPDAEWETSLSIELSDADGANVINGQAFDPKGPLLDSIELNAFYQWDLSAGEVFQEGEGYPQHPYHQHINHYLITASDHVTDGLLFRKGDFRDTIPLFESTPVGVRFYAADYTGPMMMHCHNLGHEDKGMMAVVGIDEASNDQASEDED